MNCHCKNDISSSCPNEPLIANLCKECSCNYYVKENHNYSLIEGYIKCYNNYFGLE